jgi:hypothetical protein
MYVGQVRFFQSSFPKITKVVAAVCAGGCSGSEQLSAEKQQLFVDDKKAVEWQHCGSLGKVVNTQHLEETCEAAGLQQQLYADDEHQQQDGGLSGTAVQLPCAGQLVLDDLLVSWSSRDTSATTIFFLETSEKTRLTAREACALESAAR